MAFYCIWHLFWHTFWHICWHSFWHSIWHLFRHSFWHLFWHSMWHSIWHSILFSNVLYLASILTFYSAVLSGIPSGIIWHFFCHSLWHGHCRTSTTARSQWQCPLRSGACSWGPTAIWSSRLRSRSARWDLEFAVGSRKEATLIKYVGRHLAGGKWNEWKEWNDVKMNEMREMYDMKMKWRDMKHTKNMKQTKRNEMKRNNMSWNKTKRNEMTWHEPTRNDTKRKKWNDIKTSSSCHVVSSIFGCDKNSTEDMRWLAGLIGQRMICRCKRVEMDYCRYFRFSGIWKQSPYCILNHGEGGFSGLWVYYIKPTQTHRCTFPDIFMRLESERVRLLGHGSA